MRIPTNDILLLIVLGCLMGFCLTLALRSTRRFKPKQEEPSFTDFLLIREHANIAITSLTAVVRAAARIEKERHQSYVLQLKAFGEAIEEVQSATWIKALEWAKFHLDGPFTGSLADLGVVIDRKLEEIRQEMKERANAR